MRSKNVPTLVFVTMWTRATNFKEFLTNTEMNANAANQRVKMLRKQGVNLKPLRGEPSRMNSVEDLNDVIRQEELKAKNENA